MEDRIQVLAAAVQKKVAPLVLHKDMSVVIPAFIQVTMNMAMYGLDCGPQEAASFLITALEEARSGHMN